MTSFWSQYKALMWRNISLKKRNKGQLAQELFYPVYMVAILAIIKLATNPETKPALHFPAHDIKTFGWVFTFGSRILVAPNNSEVDVWMQNIISRLPGSPSYELFPTAADAEAEYKRNGSAVACGIVFDTGISKYSYSIRFAHGAVPESDNVFNFNGGSCRIDVTGQSSVGCDVNKYLTTGFTQLQLAIEETFLMNEGVTGINFTNRNILVQLMDKGEFTTDITVIQTMSSIYFVFAFMFIANFLSVSLVTEKEKKLREGMQMMGLRDSAMWLSWFTVYLLLVMVASVAITIIIVASQFLKYSNIFLLYVIFILYGMSIIAFAFLLTPFFKKARTAGALTGFSTVVFSCIYLAVSLTRDKGSYDSNIAPELQWLMCLISPVAFAACMDQGIFLDVNMGGFGFDDSLTYGKFPLYAPILMLVVDIILYGFFAIYLDHVIPGEYGVRYSPFYLFQASYWCGGQNTVHSRVGSPMRATSQHPDIELVAPELESKVSMKISSLTKIYKVEKQMKKVVNDFNLDIYSSQITCLLGHNGAGKTTLMNMLTGVVPPSSGNATIMGLNINSSGDLEKIRSQCGICPQHNILYDMLSCKEHLEMFAAIKGVASKDIDSAVTEALKDADLADQTETFSRDLSGGQKRKLSVAIALIGDPKLIFLDEPTAGMDPFSRRHLWALLKKKKEGRTILLTTHFMDEADILADRKAFLRNGKLRCCGSSLFLKNKFGIGYHLNMVAEPDCDVERVTAALQSVIPSVEHQRTHGKEIGYTVPLSEVDLFAELFSNLDENAEELKIRSYGVSMTTLEEVFLKLEEDEGNEDSDSLHSQTNGGFEGIDGNSINMNLTNEDQSFLKSTVKDASLWKQRFFVLLRTRFLLRIRSMASVIFQIFLPVALVFAGLAVAKVNRVSPATESSPLQLSPQIYANSSANPFLPNFLVFDSINTTDSQAVITNLSNSVRVDTYNSTVVNTSNVSPHYIGMQLNSLSGKLLDGFTALYNDTAVHSIPVLITTASQNLLNMSGSMAIINVSSWTWPQSEKKLEYNGGVMGFVMLIALAFLLVIPGFSAEVVRDREYKLRSQLRIAGLDFNLYWGTIYVSNLIIYLLPSLLMLVGILAMQIDGLNTSGSMGATVLLLLTNIPFNILLGLVLAFIFDKADTCIAYLPTVINLLGMLPFITVMMVDLIADPDVASILHAIFCFVNPCYIMFGGFYYISRVYTFSTYTGKSLEVSDYFTFDIIVTIIAPVLHFIWGYWLLRVLDAKKTGGKAIEAFPCYSELPNAIPNTNYDKFEDEDEDVKAERLRIENIGSQNQEQPVAYVSNLRKIFKKRVKGKKRICGGSEVTTKVAVRNLSFGVSQGEVFGLLGPNGAGKSTALNLMIAETRPTCGKVMINGHNIRSNMLSLLNSLGYCPQHDALWELITLEEHIRCFAAVKGIASRNIDSVIDFYVSNLKLEAHRKKKAKELSGGTKRKLSYILSILGKPEFVLLDEPSTGMDPQSKRFLWDTISQTFSNSDRGAILTTHYMEEADALCSRVGIMVNGQLECLGPTQHLKNKYGSGYILEVKLGSYQAGQVDILMDQLEAHLITLFPDMETVERFMERAQYSIPKENVKSLGQTFSSLEKCKSTHSIEEYSFCQSSLEQVFLFFAKQQMDETKDEALGQGQQTNGKPVFHHMISV